MADNDGLMESIPIPISALQNAPQMSEEKKSLNASNISETPLNNSPEKNYDHVIKYLPIYKAAIENDWEKATRFFYANKLNLNVRITNFSDTPLSIAVGTNRSQRFVEELVKLIIESGNSVMLRDSDESGNNPLHVAAGVGNTEAARLLVNNDPEMAQIPNSGGHTPLKLAAAHGQKETLCYLLEKTKDVSGEEGISPYQGENGADLLALVISADFYDVALYLVRKYPNLVTEKNKYFDQLDTGLHILAAKPHAFPSGSRLGFWRRLIYSWIPINRKKLLDSSDVSPSEGITNRSQTRKASNGLNVLFWRVLELLYIAPLIKKMHDRKVKHIQVEALVKRMCCTVIDKGDHDIAWRVLGMALSTAVTHGIHELIEECIHQYPGIMWYNIDGFFLFLAAIKERQEKVYNLVHQMSGHKAYAVSDKVNRENALHFAGKLAPPHRLNTVTGAALQMQRELQWFKEVQKAVEPSYRAALNAEKKTPRMVFTSEHKALHKEAQQWMKDTSQSATVVAALIVTVAFAAIFTAPGGTDDNGRPWFLNDGVFILFATSDAIALFSSSTSVLMFLYILNSRYAEDDFLYALPRRLTIGLISLFVSLAATMVAFSATLALLLRDKIQWIAAPVSLLAGIPVLLFWWLQFPLFVELIRSTYGSGIFRKQNNSLLH
ncbi:hypothetical protein ACET3Z_021775 [Daucus carota]